MSMSASGKTGSVSEINITPLIDVLLVLLIIFMVIVPAVPKGLAADALQPSQGETQSPPNRQVVVEVRDDAHGQISYWIDQTSFAREDIEATLRIIFASREQKQMFLKGDKDLDFTQIAEIIDDAHRAGVDQVGLITPGSESAR